MSRRTVSLAVLAAAILALLILVPNVLFTIFAGILLAVLLRGAGRWFADLSPAWGIAFVLVLIITFFALGTLTFADSVSNQVDQLARQLPVAFEQMRERIDDFGWADRLLDRFSPEHLLFANSSTAGKAVTSTFGALASFVIVIFIGIYGAFDPLPYRHGFLALFAPSLRRRAAAIIDDCVASLRRWILAQLISISVVGVLTGLGLWLIGLPLALILGLIAGLLEFIPNFGPILAVVPALLLALVAGWHTVLLVLGLYLTVQALESYLLTPIVHQEAVSIPAALVITIQLLFGVTFGFIGLALAMPITAVGLTVVREVYVAGYLEREKKP